MIEIRSDLEGITHNVVAPHTKATEIKIICYPSYVDDGHIIYTDLNLVHHAAALIDNDRLRELAKRLPCRRDFNCKEFLAKVTSANTPQAVPPAPEQGTPKPWPDCSTGCKAIEYLGAGECENVCPNKF